VVVFDRIRERLRSRTRELLARLVNEACLQTIPRTVNTGLGALFILAALFILGGDTLTDFALALGAGILVGTWSSVFVAAPLLVAFERRSGHHPPPAGQPSRPKPAPVARPRPAAETTGATAGQPRVRAPRPRQHKRPARRGNGRRR